MKFEVQRETLLKPIQAVIGVVERRQTMPILSNVLLNVSGDRLTVTGTDLEVELVADSPLENAEDGEVTVPGRKFLDICRALPEDSVIKVSLEGERLILRSGKSRFTLSTLPATEFPVVEDVNASQTMTVTQGTLKKLLDRTHFCMAQQDVRYYLNGLLLEMSEERLRAVATDGHRLALCDLNQALDGVTAGQVIVPRKGVLELQRLLDGEDEEVTLEIGSNHIRATLEGMRFTSKLIDGRFPDYERVVPPAGDKIVTADRDRLRASLGRTAILSNEKYRGIRIQLVDGQMRIQAHNPEQEEAEEEVEVDYEGGELEIGFNVKYLMDAMGAIDAEQVQVEMSDSNSSCLIREPGNDDCRYVVMPMRL